MGGKAEPYALILSSALIVLTFKLITTEVPSQRCSLFVAHLFFVTDLDLYILVRNSLCSICSIRWIA